GSILYIENIERINSRGCYWVDTKPNYVIKNVFVCMFRHHVKTNGSISMKLERELNSSSSKEGSPSLLWASPYLVQ
ncbi:hypothetical protein SFRURICE_017303, partial [Spodoptera frugiperda]